MKPFDEDDLRLLLRTKEPPEGFTARVLTRAARVRHPLSKLARWKGALFARQTLRWAGALACALFVWIGIAGYRQEKKREGERARAQVMLALRITTAQLDEALSKALDVRATTMRDHKSKP